MQTCSRLTIAGKFPPVQWTILIMLFCQKAVENGENASNSGRPFVSKSSAESNNSGGGCIFASCGVVLWPMKPLLILPFKLSSIILLQAALWLSMAAPLLYIGQQEQEAEICIAAISSPDDCDHGALPIDDSDEKTDTPVNPFTPEYLQENFEQSVRGDSYLKHNKGFFDDKFPSTHLESFSPPPEC